LLPTETIFGAAVSKKLVDGITLGLYHQGMSYIQVVGNGVTSGSCFEIGSITKLFTIELMKLLVKKRIISWDDPVTLFLPERLKASNQRSSKANQITFLDLASHKSGLPIHPPEMQFLDGSNPFGNYSRSDLETYLLGNPLLKSTNTEYIYSNLGFAIIGYALECATGRSYSDILYSELLRPRGLHDTHLALVNGVPVNTVQGHSQSGRRVAGWTQDAYAPAGALCSTASDLLTWIRDLVEGQESDAENWSRAAHSGQTNLGWALDSSGEWHCREGLTGGFSSSICISTNGRTGLVLLSNRRCNLLMKALTDDCLRSLSGIPIKGLEGNYGMLSAQLLDPMRELKRSVPVLDALWSWLRRLARK
jgi:D-alanyl-D-alanine-carboxypeptidase/D-alanyl-D-alanine-endopeptidase